MRSLVRISQRRLFIVATMFASVFACSTARSDPGDVVLSVGGSYSTAVNLTENSCTFSVTVEPRPTIITHTPGAATLSLQHAITHAGTVSTNGAFTAGPTVLEDAVAKTVTTIRIAGTFNTTGFVADATVDVNNTATSTTCRYIVHWIGTKQGSLNTIP